MSEELDVLEPVVDSLSPEDVRNLVEAQLIAEAEIEEDMKAEATGEKLDVEEFTGNTLMTVPALPGVDMKAIRSRVIARANSQVGTKENPRYSNIIWAWDDCKPAWQGQPWCAAAVTSWWGRAGVDLRKALANPYYCPYLESEAKKYKAWRPSGSGYAPKPGDPILFGRGLATHVGISAPTSGNYSGYRTIEGNTSSSNAGSQTNGDGCYVRYRSGSFIRGWIDMDAFIAAMVKNGELKVTGKAAPTVKASTTGGPRPISFSAYLKSDSKGFSGNRRLIQMQLKGQGFYKGTPNGLADKAHFDAVHGYQKAIGDKAEGDFGPKQFALIAKWRNAWRAVA